MSNIDFSETAPPEKNYFPILISRFLFSFLPPVAAKLQEVFYAGT
jgi:hypothetical protein